LVEKAIDWHARHAGNAFDDLVWNEWFADAVLEQCEIEDDVSGGNSESVERSCFRGSSTR
jgi:hypothetical protein